MKISDEWETPQWLFDQLDSEFHFDIDACATKENTKCKNFYESCLTLPHWDHGDIFFMNPPYSNPKPFLLKAWEESRKGATVVCIVKCDTSTSWWGIFWDYEKHCPKPGIEIRFLPKRLRFVRSDKKLDNANFPSAIIIMKLPKE